MPKGVAIFDLAETLINLDILWESAFSELLEELNIKPEEKLLKVVEENGFDNALSYLMDYYRVPLSHSDLLKKLAHYAMRRFNSEITLKDGAEKIVAKLREEDYITVVLASGNPIIMELTKTHFAKELIMDGWINTREINLAKNEPELYQKIANDFDVPLDKCIIFDDLEEVIKSANKAGIKTVYIGEGISPNANHSSRSFLEFLENRPFD